MKKTGKWFRSPIVTVVAFALAVVLLLVSGVGTARAALTYFSEVYSTQVQMYNIGVSLLENGKVKGSEKDKFDIVSWRNYDSSAADGTWDQTVPGVLLANMLPKDEETGQQEKLILNKEYKEELAVRNTGITSGGNEAINEFVRVIIYKYWLGADSKKLTTLSPDLIKLNLVNTDSAWVEDTTAKTDERTVLYYTSLLNAGETTPLFADKLSIDNIVAKSVTQTTEETDQGTKIITKYDYDGIQFVLEAHVDAVQEHNAQDAVLSAWGRNVTINGTSLSLKD